MNNERRILIASVAALVLVVGFAVVAMRVPSSTIVQQKDVLSLPIAQINASMGADEAACAAAGGTVRWERTSECTSQPDVHDVCGFGVPCFTNGSGSRCSEARISYCACETDAQCPGTQQCWNHDRCESVPVKPLPL